MAHGSRTVLQTNPRPVVSQTRWSTGRICLLMAGLFVSLLTGVAAADIVGVQWVPAKVHDVQRNPAYPVANQPLALSDLRAPYDFSGGSFDIDDGDYFELFYVGGVDGACNPADPRVGIRLFDGEGEQKFVPQPWGYVYGLSAGGFLHEGVSYWGTVFWNTPGTSNILYTPTSGNGSASGFESCAALTAWPDPPPPQPIGEARLLQAATLDPAALDSATLSSQTRVTVQVTGEPDGTIPDIQILSSQTCTDGQLQGDTEVFGVIDNPINVATGEPSFDPDGGAYVIATLPGAPEQYVAARLTDGEVSGDLSDCIVSGPDNDSWTRAAEIDVSSPGAQGSIGAQASIGVQGFIDLPGRARWYKFTVQPNAKAVIELSNLPADYDLVVFRDIAKAYTSLTGPNDVDGLNRLGAEFAPSVQASSEISPFAFSPEEISPFAFSPFAFSPFAFSPSVYAEDAISPFAYSPFAYSPSAISPFAFSPFAYSPFAFSPFAYSPFAFSPFAFSAEDYASAQTRSVIAVSAQSGTGSERVSALTWDNTGDFYVRVVGKNGANDDQTPFVLTVDYDGGLCNGVEELTSSELDALAGLGVGGGYQTIILHDSSRMLTEGIPTADQQRLVARLNALAARAEVKGVVVDLGTLASVQMLHAQANEASSCPYAENLTADAIKRVIDAYRAANPDLAYVVLAGSDSQIPFFRYPDQTLLGPEQNYDPPMADDTQSQAALRLNYVLGQDQYGASTTLSLRDGQFPIPDLAVGRLVETPDEMITLIDAYLATTNGVVPTPQSILVTGYDFLEDAATAIRGELVAGTSGARSEALITPADVSPDDPSAWNADALRNALLAEGEDLIYLAGHFNAFSALAADFKTSMLSTELTASGVDLTHSLVFSNGCHSGYNVVNGEVKLGVALPLDWAQAFARKGATFIGGTGYQYGDTEFIEFGERLYLEFARELRTGVGAVSIGQALVKAKQTYLEQTADNKGLHRKSLLISTLFGLPMLKVNMPGERLPDDSDSSAIVTVPVVFPPPESGFPPLGLLSAELALDLENDELTEKTIEFSVLQPPSSIRTLTASYLGGPDGLSVNPGEPVLPLKSINVSVPDQSLRGVGFRGGRWREESIIPVDGAATTELRAAHTPFGSLLYYPMRLAVPNYYGALGETGSTRLNITPVQHRVANIGDEEAIRRRFDTIDFRLYYSDNTVTYGANRPALSAPPTLTGARVVTDGAGKPVFLVNVVGDPAAGIPAVWVVHTAFDGGNPGPQSGVWWPLDLVQDPDDSSLWSATLEEPERVPADLTRLNAIFVACNGMGLCSTDDNYGAYYQVVGAIGDVGDDGQPANLAPTTLTLDSGVPGSAGSGDTITVEASLQRQIGSPAGVDGAVVQFTLGSVTRSATTDSSGTASVALPLKVPAGEYRLVASFAGQPLAGLAGSSDEEPFTVTKAAAMLTIAGGTQRVNVDGISTGVSVMLTSPDDGGPEDNTPLSQRTVYFTVTGGPLAVSRTVAAITDFRGVAQLGELALPPGSYSVTAQFLGVIPNALDEIVDPVYAPATSAVLTLDLIGSASCPTAPLNKAVSLTGFCYLTAPVNGKIDIVDGTLIVSGGRVDQKIEQYGAGGVQILQGASVRGFVTERGAGDVFVNGEVGGNVSESGAGDVLVGTTGVVKGLLTETGDGSIHLLGRVTGNLTESGAGDVIIENSASVLGNATESGQGRLENRGRVTGRVQQD